MNWSGGALSRSRSSNASRSAAQKRNFAKARTLPQARQTFADFDFSTLEHARIEIEKEAPPRRSPAHPPPQPLRSPSRATPSSLRKQIKSRPLGSSPSLKQNHTSGLGIRRGDVNISAEARLEAQKQELLAIKDWCGLENTRPAKIVFPDIADVDLIGKRRPVLKANHERASRHGEKRPRVEAGGVKPLKKRKIYLVEDSDKSCRKDKSSLPCRDNSCAKQSATDAEHNCRCSNSDEMLLDTTIATKYSGASFHSDENLFDLENAIQAFRQRSPMHMSLSPQIPSTFRPSPLRNEIDEVDLRYDESDGKFDAISDLSQKHSREILEGRLDSRLLSKPTSHNREDIPRFTHVSSPVQHKADYNNAEPRQSGKLPAQPTRLIPHSEHLDEPVPFSPGISTRPSDACMNVKTSKSDLHLTSESKAGMPATFPMEDIPTPKRDKKSPLASATLLSMNDLKRQSICQTPTTAAIAKVTDKFELVPSPCDPTETVVQDSVVLAKHEARTAKREQSLSPETVWRNFVLGNSDDESVDDKYEFILPTSPGPRCQQEASVDREPRSMYAEPSSSNAEPSRRLNPDSPTSADELAPSPACVLKPKILFTKPSRFQGGGSDVPLPLIRLGRQRRWAKAYAPNSSDEDDITDD